MYTRAIWEETRGTVVDIKTELIPGSYYSKGYSSILVIMKPDNQLIPNIRYRYDGLEAPPFNIGQRVVFVTYCRGYGEDVFELVLFDEESYGKKQPAEVECGTVVNDTDGWTAGHYQIGIEPDNPQKELFYVKAIPGVFKKGQRVIYEKYNNYVDEYAIFDEEDYKNGMRMFKNPEFESLKKSLK